MVSRQGSRFVFNRSLGYLRDLQCKAQKILCDIRLPNLGCDRRFRCSARSGCGCIVLMVASFVIDDLSSPAQPQVLGRSQLGRTQVYGLSLTVAQYPLIYACNMPNKKQGKVWQNFTAGRALDVGMTRHLHRPLWLLGYPATPPGPRPLPPVKGNLPTLVTQ